MEKRIGPTPNGGDYAVLLWLDADGRPTEKERAVEGRILEYRDDGTLLHTTYLEPDK